MRDQIYDNMYAIAALAFACETGPTCSRSPFEAIFVSVLSLEYDFHEAASNVTAFL